MVIALLALVLAAAGCVGPSLMTDKQAASIRERDRALARHASAIHTAIQQSGRMGALAFLDDRDGHLVVLPGDSPADAWARYSDSPEGQASRVSLPPVMRFVHRADVPEPPETITRTSLQHYAEMRASVAALERDVRDAHRQIQERLEALQKELADAVAASRKGTDAALAAARADLQKSLNSFSDDLAAMRQFQLQTAQLGWLNHEMNVENAGGIRRVTSASQELSASAARLQEAVRQLSDSLSHQLKELTGRLEAIQARIGALK